MTDWGPAVREYEEWCDSDALLHARVDDDGKWLHGDFVYKVKADAAIAELQQTIEEMRKKATWQYVENIEDECLDRERCGNCHHYWASDMACGLGHGRQVMRHERCQKVPSCWEKVDR